MYEWVDGGHGPRVKDYKTSIYCHIHDTNTGVKDTEITPPAPANIFLPVKIKSTYKIVLHLRNVTIKGKFFMRCGRNHAACTFQ